MRPFVYWFIVIAACSALSVGCGSAGHDGPIGFGREVTAALLFVESVIIPEEIVEFEPFTIGLKVSALRNPKVLNGLDLMQFEWSTFASVPGWGIKWPAWIRDADRNLESSEPPVHEFTYEFPGFSAGTYVLLVETADSPEWGGVIKDYYSGNLSPLTKPRHVHAIVREYEFVVLPAEDGGGKES